MMRAFRFCLAGAVVLLAPTVVAVWLQLNVSGYTFRADGSRELGHFAKAAGEAPIWMMVFGVPTLAVALACIAFTRIAGPLTIRRLVAVAAIAGGALGLVPPLVLLAGPGSPPIIEVAAFPLAGAALAAVLSGTVAVILKLPWGARDDGPSAMRQTLDRAVLTASSGLVLAAIAWVGSIWAYGLAHPCCG